MAAWSDEVGAVLERSKQRRSQERVVGHDEQAVPVRRARRSRPGPRFAGAGWWTSPRTGASSVGVIAASIAARSVMSTAVTSMPRRGRSSCHRTTVIANSSSPTTMWSPCVEVREQRGRHGRHPRRRDDRVLGPLERGDLLLERAVRGVAGPRVEVRGRVPLQGRVDRRPPSRPRCRRRTWPSRRSACCGRGWSGSGRSPAWIARVAKPVPSVRSPHARPLLGLCRCWSGSSLGWLVVRARTRAQPPGDVRLRHGLHGLVDDAAGRGGRRPRPRSGSPSGVPGFAGESKHAPRGPRRQVRRRRLAHRRTSCAAGSSRSVVAIARVRGGLRAVPARPAGARPLPRRRPAATCTTTRSRTSTTATTTSRTRP